jgi:regulator of sigma E protease
VTPRVNAPENEGAVGIGLGSPLAYKSYPVWKAVPMGFRASYNTIINMYVGIRAAIGGQIPFEVSGPIGIYKATTEVAKTGLSETLTFSAFLSLNLFLVNLLPLPALDGGRLIFILLELVRGGRRIAPEKEGAVHAIGMLVLLAVMAVVTFYDYQRYFG